MSSQNRLRAFTAISILISLAIVVAILGSIGFYTRDVGVGLGVLIGALLGWTMRKLRRDAAHDAEPDRKRK